MENSTIALAFAGVALTLNLVQRIFGSGWNLKDNLAAIETRLTEAIETARTEIEETLDSTRYEFDQKQERTNHNVGDSVNALKQHVQNVEFHIRDNYMRKDDFLIHMKQHDDFLTTNFANVTQRLERIEKKQDERQ